EGVLVGKVHLSAYRNYQDVRLKGLILLQESESSLRMRSRSLSVFGQRRVRRRSKPNHSVGRTWILFARMILLDFNRSPHARGLRLGKYRDQDSGDQPAKS